MRKALLIMGLAVTMFAVGCSDNGSNNGGSGDGSGKTGTTLVEEAEVDEYGWEEVVPKYDDIFVSGELRESINSKRVYSIVVSDCNKEEFDKYVTLVKESGFNKVIASTDDGVDESHQLEAAKYRVSLSFSYIKNTGKNEASISFTKIEND